MKRQAYCGKDELIDLLKIDVLAAESEIIAARTPEKDWAKKTCSTYLSKMVEERIAALDVKQRTAVLRRCKHSAIKIYTSDQNRLKQADDNKPEEEITISTDDFFDVLDLAAQNCKACPQGECIKQCYYRDIFHRLDVPVVRDNPSAGQCEFGYNEVTPMKHQL